MFGVAESRFPRLGAIAGSDHLSPPIAVGLKHWCVPLKTSDGIHE